MSEREVHEANGEPIYTDDDVQKIIDIYAKTTHGLVSICGKDGLMSRSKFYAFLESNAKLKDNYTRAKKLHKELMAYETLEIADDGRNDYYKDDRGITKVDNEHVNRSKLRVETRFKLLQFLDGQDNKNNEAPVSTTVIFLPSSEKPKEP